MNIEREFMNWAKKKDPYCLYIGFLSMANYYKKKAEEETDPIKKEKYLMKNKMAFKESQKYLKKLVNKKEKVLYSNSEIISSSLNQLKKLERIKERLKKSDSLFEC